MSEIREEGVSLGCYVRLLFHPFCGKGKKLGKGREKIEARERKKVEGD